MIETERNTAEHEKEPLKKDRERNLTISAPIDDKVFPSPASRSQDQDEFSQDSPSLNLHP